MGGGVMRTAARAAVLGGYRSSPIADRVLPAGLRRTAPAGTATCSPVSSDDIQVGVPVVQGPAWEVDERDFVGAYEEELVDAGPHRMVFGPAPTLEEAEEATADLKDAIEKVYFPSLLGHDGSQFTGKWSSVASSFPNTESNKYATTSSSALFPSAPKHVIQAFSFLQESPEAQNVVATLASDKNVWDAVMKNEKVVDFYRSHQTSTRARPKKICTENEDVPVERILDCFTEKPLGSARNAEMGLKDVVDTIKMKVTQMVAGLSDFIQDLMGSSTESRSSTATVLGTSSEFTNVAMGASFVALAVATILVVFLKRV